MEFMQVRPASCRIVSNANVDTNQIAHDHGEGTNGDL